MHTNTTHTFIYPYRIDQALSFFFSYKVSEMEDQKEKRKKGIKKDRIK